MMTVLIRKQQHLEISNTSEAGARANATPLEVSGLGIAKASERRAPTGSVTTASVTSGASTQSLGRSGQRSRLTRLNARTRRRAGHAASRCEAMRGGALATRLADAKLCAAAHWPRG